MKGQKLFNLRIGRMVLRFYFFMALVIVLAYAGVPWSISLPVALAIFLTGLLGIPFFQGDLPEVPEEEVELPKEEELPVEVPSELKKAA